MTAFLPGRHEIEAYGGGGFRFSSMSHRGSIMALPSGIHGWDVSWDALRPQDFEAALNERDAIDIFLLGTGEAMRRPAPAVRRAFEDAGMGLDYMATGHAIATYNLLLAERRKVAGAFLAVDHRS